MTLWTNLIVNKAGNFDHSNNKFNLDLDSFLQSYFSNQLNINIRLNYN